jgi:putative ABC transport system permease protein
VVIISKTDDIGNQIQSFEKALLANPDVLKVSNSSAIPGNQGGDSGCSLKDTPGSQLRDAWIMTCDENFAETYKLKMMQGRFFSSEHPSDTAAIVVNEALTKAFGVKNIVGKYLVFPGDVQTFTYQIIGVVKNFNYESLHKEIRPLVIRLYPERGFGQFVSVRIAPNNYQSTISFLQNTWKKYAGNEAFEYNFLDKDLANLYLNEQRTSNIATIFSVLAIFIACQRTKEIGIRKSLGASVPEIVFLLSKEFTKWVLVANAIAWPLAYFIMNNWLMNFAYRITITPWVFLISGIIALLIALLTVSIHAIRAATTNPILSLRYE